jgi:hypothetical protein
LFRLASPTSNFSQPPDDFAFINEINRLRIKSFTSPLTSLEPAPCCRAMISTRHQSGSRRTSVATRETQRRARKIATALKSQIARLNSESAMKQAHLETVHSFTADLKVGQFIFER